MEECNSQTLCKDCECFEPVKEKGYCKNKDNERLYNKCVSKTFSCNKSKAKKQKDLKMYNKLKESKRQYKDDTVKAPSRHLPTTYAKDRF